MVYLPFPVPRCVNLAKTTIKPEIIPITNTYGQYVVKTVVAKSTVELTITVINVDNVLDALGIKLLL